jgi:Protein of unknown function (DUF3551)
MRGSSALAITTIFILSISAEPSAATVIYPWCAFMGRSGQNCGFTTFRQCLATLSGIGGYCGTNPWYPGLPSPSGAPPLRRRP